MTDEQEPPPVWVTAIQRLMATRGYRSQAALIAAAHSRGLHLRANTLSGALRTTRTTFPRLDTMMAIAAVLEVPLWRLFCEADKDPLFDAMGWRRTSPEVAAWLDYFEQLSDPTDRYLVLGIAQRFLKYQRADK